MEKSNLIIQNIFAVSKFQKVRQIGLKVDIW